MDQFVLPVQHGLVVQVVDDFYIEIEQDGPSAFSAIKISSDQAKWLIEVALPSAIESQKDA